MHLVRQATSVSIRKNENRRSPVRTAPRILVAANSIAKSTTDSNIVAIIAPNRTVRIVLMQQGVIVPQHFRDTENRSRIPRYTTAIPKTVHKNAGVTVIAAVILRKAVIIPTTILIIRAAVVQVLFLHGQSDVDILFTSVFIIWTFSREVKRGEGGSGKILRILWQTALPSASPFTAPEPPEPAFGTE